MNSRAGNFYAAWRQKHQDTAFLRDENPVPPEKLLQAIWQHQRIQRAQLKTAGGKSVRVLHPGFISLEGGPDFRGAVLQIGNEPPISGDVEIDLQASGWHAHGHDTNPAFKNVMLHVVWAENQKTKSKIQGRFESLALENFLDSPLAELALALENEANLPEKLRGKCSAPLRGLAGPGLTELLHAAARVRFQNKAGAMRARAKHGGWEAALWENLFRALGYKHNLWPMQHLAEQRSRLMAFNVQPMTLLALQARLLGVSGLLPPDLTRTQKSSDTFLRRAWDFWWRERDGFADGTLPRTTWKFHGVRPANHPQRRLALAAHWLADDRLLSQLERWITREIPANKLLRSLHNILAVDNDEFWSWHWTFQSARMAKPQPLLGETRVTDLAVNVILPWLWIRAKEGGNEQIQSEVERRFFTWPAAEDNSLLKLARQRLLGIGHARILKSAATQQGLIQIVRDFCEHSNAICADCRFPELVNGFKTGLPVEADS
ncbi:MAG TPA: DUF2851 family protein [Verrucomicrobiae bacterium]|jgi:hypothetical protein